jgi:hypothetical protein
MGLFDDYFDPQQFEGGGLLGRMLSLQQQQGQYQPSQGLDATSGQPASVEPPQRFPSAESSTPIAPVQQTAGPTAYIPIGNYLMPQFGGAGVPQPPIPDLGDRLSAGFQSWAHTPLGNPFAGLANGIAGFSSGQTVSQPSQQNSPPRTDTPQQPPVSEDVPPSVPVPAGSSQRTLVGRILPRPNNVGFGRSFRYGG